MNDHYIIYSCCIQNVQNCKTVVIPRDSMCFGAFLMVALRLKKFVIKIPFPYNNPFTLWNHIRRPN